MKERELQVLLSNVEDDCKSMVKSVTNNRVLKYSYKVSGMPEQSLEERNSDIE